MPEMNCPACGAGGRILRDKIGARLVCKKCLKVFHVTPSGQAVLGEPPAPKVAAKEKISKDPTGYQASEALDELASKFAKIQLPTPKTMGIVAGIVLVVGLGYWLFSRQSLETRARRVAEAIASSDIKKIVDISVPGTETAVIVWYADVYKEYLRVKVLLGRSPIIKIDIPGTSGRLGAGDRQVFRAGPSVSRAWHRRRDAADSESVQCQGLARRPPVFRR